MISPKKLLLYALLLFICESVMAQRYTVSQIDSMLFSARETVIDYPTITVFKSKLIFDASKHIDYADGQDYALLLLCYSYYFAKDYDLLITNYVKLDESARKHMNSEVLAHVTLLKAKTLSRLTHYQKSFEELEKMPKLIKQIRSEDSQKMFLGLTNHQKAGVMMNTLKSRDSTLHYDILAKNEFERISNSRPDGFSMYTKDDLLYLNYTYIANEFMALERYDSVDFYLNKVRQLRPRYPDHICEVLLYNNTAWKLMLNKNYEEAIGFYLKSVEVSKKCNDLERLVSAYDGLSIVYEAKDDYKNATKYMSLATRTAETDKILHQSAVSSSLDGLINEKEVVFKKKNDSLFRILIIIAFFTLICLLAVVLLYKKFKREKLTKEQTKVLLSEKMALMEQESKNIERNKPVIHLQEIVMLAINNDPSFYIKFQEAFPDFIQKLLEIAPSMVASELKTAAYIKLDFSTKEIAKYTNMSVRAVEAKKYRLRKKLNIPSESDTNIWMSKI